MSTIQNAFLDAFQGKRPEQPKITDFAVAEVAALIAAIGLIAHEHGLFIGAVQDGDSDEQLIQILVKKFDMDEGRANTLIGFQIGDHLDAILYGEGR